MAKIEINNVKNRFLPIPESVQRGLEREPKITDFSILKELGSGSFGHVYLVTHKKTKVQYAIKAIDKRDKTNIEEKPYFRREVEVMYKINHPNVVKLYGHFEDNNYCYFIMEYISKGNIYGLIPTDKKKRISTQLVVSLIKDVICAVYFLHNMNPPIIHRDIKPENVLLSDGLIAKLTDFGWSNYMQDEQKRTTVCGTPIYLAPEIIKEEGHDENVDIWCIGVLLFEMLTSNVPFPGNDFETLKNNILKLKIAWPKDINPEAKDLISQILKTDPKSRISLIDILSHPFITKYFPNAVQSLKKPDSNEKHIPFIVSEDDPKKLDSKNIKDNNIKLTEKDKSPKKLNQNSEKNPTDGKAPKMEEKNISEKYQILKEKYEKLFNDYTSLKTTGNIKEPNDNELKSLKNILKEKEEKLAQLYSLLKHNSGENNNNENNDESYLKMKVDELEKENESIKNKLRRYEEFLKMQQGGKLEGNLVELRNSLNNREQFSKALENLKKQIDDNYKNSLNEIIKEKEEEIRKIKEHEKIRRDKEKKKFSSIINKYDQTLDYLAKENEGLKEKIKVLMLKKGISK